MLSAARRRRGRGGDRVAARAAARARAERAAAARRRFAIDGQVIAFTALVSVLTGAALRHPAVAAVLDAPTSTTRSRKACARRIQRAGLAAFDARRRRVRPRGRAARRRRAARPQLLAAAARRARIRSGERADREALAAAAERSRPGPLLAPYHGHQARLATYEEILRRAAALPGVTRRGGGRRRCRSTAAAARSCSPRKAPRATIGRACPTAQYTLGDGRAISR